MSDVAIPEEAWDKAEQVLRDTGLMAGSDCYDVGSDVVRAMAPLIVAAYLDDHDMRVRHAEASGVVRAVMDLHKPVSVPVTFAACEVGDCGHNPCPGSLSVLSCDHCTTLASAWTDRAPVEEWPCQTVRDLAVGLGVSDVPEG